MNKIVAKQKETKDFSEKSYKSSETNDGKKSSTHGLLQIDTVFHTNII